MFSDRDRIDLVIRQLEAPSEFFHCLRLSNKFVLFDLALPVLFHCELEFAVGTHAGKPESSGLEFHLGKLNWRVFQFAVLDFVCLNYRIVPDPSISQMWNRFSTRQPFLVLLSVLQQRTERSYNTLYHIVFLASRRITFFASVCIVHSVRVLNRSMQYTIDGT
jgi:hypothetical protein